MMETKKIKIFCEGITDQIFIADCIELFYGFESIRENRRTSKNGDNKISIKFKNGIEILDVGGCNNFTNAIYIAELEDNNGANIVIFDADHTGQENGNKGFNACVCKLENIKKRFKVDFNYYIWPNHKDDGIVENLLKKLIPNDKQTIYECIESHQNCLGSLNFNLRVAELKEKVGYYLYTCNQKSKPIERNYKDVNFWNMEVQESSDLLKFKKFLDLYFDSTN